jgi:gamma-glutamylcyclotransferase (GGCT)/AIG2-like uncharacterized protein YtfP
LSDHHVFVYGTLRRGSDNPFAQLLSERGRFIGTARISGRLYDFGSYPGARPSDQAGETIMGEIFYLEEPAALLSALDEYEGPEFERAVITATGPVDCWIYWYVGAETGRWIVSGDWFNR